MLTSWCLYLGHFLLAIGDGMTEDKDLAIFHSFHIPLQNHTFPVTNVTSFYFACILVTNGLLITSLQRGTFTHIVDFSSEITEARSQWKHIFKTWKNSKNNLLTYISLSNNNILQQLMQYKDLSFPFSLSFFLVLQIF